MKNIKKWFVPVSINGCFKLLLICMPLLVSFSRVHSGARGVSPAAGALAGVHPSGLTTNDRKPPKKETVFQHGIQALKTCANKYAALEKFRMDVEYAVFYNSENFDQPSDIRKGKIIRQSDNFYQEEMGIIKVVNSDYELVLNERAEFITIRNRVEKKIVPVDFETDSLACFISQVEKTRNGFIYHLNEGEIQKIEVILDQDGYLDTWRSWYRKQMDFGQGEVKVVTQMRYLNFVKNPKISRTVFSTDPFVSVTKKGEVIPRGKYKNYRLLNQLVRD